MEKVLYIVTGYIPSDEDIIQTNIYKLQCIGSKSKKYIFIAIEDTGGIGTSCDDWGSNTAEDAIINSTNYLHGERFRYIKTNDFNKVISIRDGIIKGLEKELDDKT